MEKFDLKRETYTNLLYIYWYSAVDNYSYMCIYIYTHNWNYITALARLIYRCKKVWTVLLSCGAQSRVWTTFLMEAGRKACHDV